MFRLREPNLNLVVSYLRSDGSTMDEYSLYQFEWKDDQWPLHVNIPFLNKKIETAIELHSENLGLEEAKGVPLDDLLYLTVSNLCEAHQALEIDQGEESHDYAVTRGPESKTQCCTTGHLWASHIVEQPWPYTS